jgi:hypothetical protein
MQHLLLGSLILFFQTTATPFDPRDLSGHWNRVSPLEGFNNVPGSLGRNRYAGPIAEAPLTPDGKAALEENVPGVGPRAADPTRRKNNDPMNSCDPMGIPRLLNVEIIEPHNTMEIIQLPGKFVQLFEWHHEWREVFTDGRQLPNLDDTDPKFNGYSVGRWEGDTFVVRSMGFDDRTWLDKFGYPHTEEMQLEERYRRVDPDTMELTMTVTDPEYYSKPWVSDKKIFKRDRERVRNWDEQAFCVPSVEFQFNDLIRDGGFGK